MKTLSVGVSCSHILGSTGIFCGNLLECLKKLKNRILIEGCRLREDKISEMLETSQVGSIVPYQTFFGNDGFALVQEFRSGIEK